MRRWGIDAERAELLSHLSGGRLGWAALAAQDPSILNARAARLDDLQQMLGASRVERLAYAQTMARDAVDTREAIDVWRTWWRDVMLVAAGSAARLTNVDRRGEIGSMAARLDVQSVRSAAEACSRALWQLDKNATPRLVVEVMLLNLPRM